MQEWKTRSRHELAAASCERRARTACIFFRKKKQPAFPARKRNEIEGCCWVLTSASSLASSWKAWVSFLSLSPLLLLRKLVWLQWESPPTPNWALKGKGVRFPFPGSLSLASMARRGWARRGGVVDAAVRPLCLCASLCVRACVPLQPRTSTTATRLGSAPRTRPRRARVPGRAGTAGPGGPRNSDPGPASPVSFRFRLPWWPWSRGLPSFPPKQSLARDGQVGTGRVWPRLSVKRVGRAPSAAHGHAPDKDWAVKRTGDSVATPALVARATKRKEKKKASSPFFCLFLAKYKCCLCWTVDGYSSMLYLKLFFSSTFASEIYAFLLWKWAASLAMSIIE